MNKGFPRRQFLVLGAAYGLARGSPALAQATYPDKPIKLVVPLPAGGSHDAAGRVFANALSAELKQPVIVENKVGATGHVGGEFLARSAPDGYTLGFVASSSQAASPHMMKLNYKPMEDLIPVALVVTTDIVVIATKSLPVQNIPELIAYAKANPDKLSFGSYGGGGNQHLGGEMLCTMGGIQMVHVPYSSNQLLPDLISGRIQVFVTPLVGVEPMVQAGSLKIIGVASQARLPQLPQVATVAETIPGFAVNGWGMLMAPAGTPLAILQKLNAASNKALSNDQVKEALTKLRLTPATLTLAETKDFMHSEWARWGKVIRDAKIPMVN